MKPVVKLSESAIEPDWGVRLALTPAIPSAFLSRLGSQ